MGVIAYLDFILCRHININTSIIWRLERDKIMNDKVREAWRTIYAILQTTGYDILYEDEIKVMVDFIKEHLK